MSAFDSVQCPTCQTSMPASARFCPGCGRPRSWLRDYLEAEARSTGIPYLTLLERARHEMAAGATITGDLAELRHELRRMHARIDSLESRLSGAPAVVAETRSALTAVPVHEREREREPSWTPEWTIPTVRPVEQPAAPPVFEERVVAERPVEAPELVAAEVALAPEPEPPARTGVSSIPPEPVRAPSAERDMPLGALEHPTRVSREQPRPVAVPELLSPPPLTAQPAAPRNWGGLSEAALSGRVLAWAGGLALLVGAVFFLSLAFSRGWIGPSERVSIGIASGFALVVGGGWFFERREKLFGHVLVAVGLGVLSMSFLAGTRLYDLFPVELGLLGTLASALLACGIAVRVNSQVVAGYGLVAALAAPPILGTTPDGATVAYLAAVLVGTTGIALYRAWRWLPPVAFLLAAPQLADWAFSDPPAGPLLAALAGFWLLNALAAGGEEYRLREGRLSPTSATLLLANAAYTLWIGFTALDGDLERFRGLFLVLLAAAHAALAFPFLRRWGDRNPFGLLLAGTGLASLTMAVPIQLGGPVVPIAWAAEAAALAWVWSQRRHGYAAGASALLGALAVGHLIVFEYRIAWLADDLDSRWPFLNANGGTLAFLLGALAVAGYVSGVAWVRRALATLGAMLVIYALPYELSGIALVAGWAVVFVASLAVLRYWWFGIEPYEARWVSVVPVLGRELVIPAALAAALAVYHALTWEMPLNGIDRVRPPDVPFWDTPTATAAILLAATAAAGWLARGSLGRASALIAGAAIAAWLMPFELDRAPMVVVWSALAFGLLAAPKLVAFRERFDLLAMASGTLLVGGAWVTLASVAELRGVTQVTPDGVPFWSAETLAIGALVAALLGIHLLWQREDWAHVPVIAAAGALAYLMPFELDRAPMVVAWSAIAGGLYWLPRWQPARLLAYATSAFALNVAGGLVVIGSLATLAQLRGDAAIADHTPFWSAATLATAAIVASLATGFWLWRADRHAPLLPTVGALLVAWLLPFELGPAATVLGWSVVVVALVALAGWHRDGEALYLTTGGVLFSIALVTTLVGVAPPERLAVDAGTTLDHPLLWSGATVALGGLAAALAFARWRYREWPRAGWLDALSAALVVYLLSVGIVDEFQRRVGGATALEELQKQAQVGLSILWATLGVAAVVAGIARLGVHARFGGLALLALATAKVFIVDLASLDAAYRVLSFIGLGILLLASSWAYLRLQPGGGPPGGPRPAAGQ